MNKMTDMSPDCSICNSEQSNRGCVCEEHITFLGNQCLAPHISNTEVDHNLVDLDLALRMHKNPSLISFYLNELAEVPKVLHFLRRQLDNVKYIKNQLTSMNKNLVPPIEDIFAKPAIEIQHIEEELTSKIKSLTMYKTSLCQEGKLLMETYRAQGLECLVKNTIGGDDMPIDDLNKYIANILFKCNKNREKDRLIEEYRKEVSRLSEIGDTHNQIIKQKDSQIQKLEALVNEKDRQIQHLYAKVAELTPHIYMPDISTPEFSLWH